MPWDEDKYREDLPTDGITARRTAEQNSWGQEDNGWSDWFMDIEKSSK